MTIERYSGSSGFPGLEGAGRVPFEKLVSFVEFVEDINVACSY